MISPEGDFVVSAAADIRQARRRLGLTQAEVAHRAGVAVRTVRDLERGRAAPRPDTIQRLDRVLSSPETDHDLPRVRVLGPMIVDAPDGVRMHLASRRRQVLLAMLAVHPNEPVRADELLELAWPEPARGTAAALHTQISRLRQTLRPLQLDHDAGYRLAATGDDLDLIRFRDLATQARRHRAAGRLDEAVRAGCTACALVRGPVLDNLPELAGHPMVVAIRREVVSSVLDLADTALAAGSAADAVEALRAASDREPLDESIATRLIQVLHATGKRALALDSYRALRARLAAELGVDPSADLQQAYEDALGSTTPTLTRPVPRQLPPDVGGFTGRDAALRQLDEQLTNPGAAVIITAIGGAGGVGKTALAVHWAHRAASAFPDGQLYVDLQGFSPLTPLRPIDALARFLAALGVPADQIPTGVEQSSALYRSLLSDARVLVVLDNAIGPDQVRPLLPASSNGLVLVTSRDRLAGLAAKDGATRLTLDTLTADESQLLLGNMLGRARVTGDPDAAARLAALCDNLPLALRIAAANFDDRHGSLGAYVNHLAGSDRLDALRIDGDEHLAVRAVFDASYAELRPRTQRVFRLLGLVPGIDFTPEAVAALADLGDAAASHELAALAARYLVDEHRPGRYRLHDLLRLYARECAHDDPERDAAIGRLTDWYSYTADAASELLHPQVVRMPLPQRDPLARPQPHQDVDAALAWLDAERANLVSAVQGVAGGAGRLLAGTLRTYLLVYGHLVDMVTVADAVVGDPDAEDRSLAAAHTMLSDAARYAGDYPGAIGHRIEASRLALTGDWPEARASAIGGLGIIYTETGRLPEAVACYREALATHRAAGRRSGLATNWLNLGYSLLELGDLDGAARAHHEALELARDEGLLSIEGGALNGLGGVSLGRGQLRESRAFRIEALETFAKLGTGVVYAAGIPWQQAAVERDAGNFDAALDLANHAIALALQHGLPNEQAHAFNTLAGIEHRLGHLHDADRAFGNALRITERSKSRFPQIEALIGLATTALGRRDVARARERGEQALALARDSSTQLREADALLVIGQCDLAEDNGAGAALHTRQALAISRRTGARLHEGRALAQLGRVHDAADEAAPARKRWTEALAIFSDCGAAPEAEEVRALLA